VEVESKEKVFEKVRKKKRVFGWPLLINLILVFMNLVLEEELNKDDIYL
jgi:uncharacterized membrane protein (DUF485 family)